jgi:hypothetical protein
LTTCYSGSIQSDSIVRSGTKQAFQSENYQQNRNMFVPTKFKPTTPGAGIFSIAGATAEQSYISSNCATFRAHQRFEINKIGSNQAG